MDGRHVYSDISKSSWVDDFGQPITIYLINNVFNLRIYLPRYGEKPCRVVTQRKNAEKKRQAERQNAKLLHSC